MYVTGLDPMSPFSSAMTNGLARVLDTVVGPAAMWTQKRNAALDCLFYDVSNLTLAEYVLLLGEINRAR